MEGSWKCGDLVTRILTTDAGLLSPPPLSTPQTIYTGSSIGNKHIALLPQRMRLSEVVVAVTTVAPTNVTFGAYNC